MNFNKAIIVGNLTRDPETRTLPSGQPVVSFSIATNRVWNDASGNKQEAAEFHNIVAFGKLADICSKYLSKGRLVLIEGRIQTRSWQDQQTNVKKYRTEIIAENMQMGPRSERVESAPQAAPQAAPQEDIPVIEAEPAKNEVDVKNIPF
jgi:single-strand DNA-binding protein